MILTISSLEVVESLLGVLLEESEEYPVDFSHIEKWEEVMIVCVVHKNSLLCEEIERVFHQLAIPDVSLFSGEKIWKHVTALCITVEAHSFHKRNRVECIVFTHFGRS